MYYSHQAGGGAYEGVMRRQSILWLAMLMGMLGAVRQVDAQATAEPRWIWGSEQAKDAGTTWPILKTP